MWEIIGAILWHFGAGALGIYLICVNNNVRVQIIGAILVSIFILTKPW